MVLSSLASAATLARPEVPSAAQPLVKMRTIAPALATPSDSQNQAQSPKAVWNGPQSLLHQAISTEIADIFRNNSLKNGLLPAVVDEATHQWVLEHPGADVEIDLASCTLRFDGGRETRFPVDAFARYCLMNGIDELGFLLSQVPAIEQYERTPRSAS